MRRGINIRKKKQIVMKETNKKALKLICILMLFIIICTIIYFSFFQDLLIKNSLEKDGINFSELNETIPFSVKKVILFSNATAESNSVNQQLCLDISQYSDIGIYLNKIEDNSISISSLYIDNIIISSSEIGTSYLYKKSTSDLGKCSFDENNIINDTVYFNIIDSNDDLNYDNYELYNNGNSAISLGFYNKNIKTGFFPDNSEVYHNGTLLKEASIPLSSLKCTISFRINIVTNSNEHYICNMNFDIPFEDDNGSIYDTGYITKEIYSKDLDKFIRLN